MFLTGYFTLPISGGAFIASCVIDVSVAAMQLAVAQYEDATNFLGHTIAETSLQRIEAIVNHDCFPPPISNKHSRRRLGCATFQRPPFDPNAAARRRPGASDGWQTLARQQQWLHLLTHRAASI
jgi:hypothetical protein